MVYNINTVLDSLRASGSTWREIAMMPEEQLLSILSHVGYDADEDLIEYVEAVACDYAAEYES